MLIIFSFFICFSSFAQDEKIVPIFSKNDITKIQTFHNGKNCSVYKNGADECGYIASDGKFYIKDKLFSFTNTYIAKSFDNENINDFIKRISPFVYDYSKNTGYETCGVIASNGQNYSIVMGSNQSHIVCLNIPNLTLEGYFPTGETLHTHPGPAGGSFVVNKTDKFILGPLAPIKSVRGQGGFSEDDYKSGPGYVIENSRVLYQNGKKTQINLASIDR